MFLRCAITPSFYKLLENPEYARLKVHEQIKTSETALKSIKSGPPFIPLVQQHPTPLTLYPVVEHLASAKLHVAIWNLSQVEVEHIYVSRFQVFIMKSAKDALLSALQVCLHFGNETLKSAAYQLLERFISKTALNGALDKVIGYSIDS